MSGEDEQQIAEETGHKPRKASQQNLEGDEVEVAEGFVVDDQRTRDLTKKFLHFAKQIPALNHIDNDIIQVVLSNKEKRMVGNKRGNIHVFAECMKVRPVLLAIADSQKATLKPFVITVFPPFFKEPEHRREQIMIHEMYHIKEPNENTGKMGMRPHSGWGDSDIEKLHRLIKQ